MWCVWVRQCWVSLSWRQFTLLSPAPAVGSASEVSPYHALDYHTGKQTLFLPSYATTSNPTIIKTTAAQVAFTMSNDRTLDRLPSDFANTRRLSDTQPIVFDSQEIAIPAPPGPVKSTGYHRVPHTTFRDGDVVKFFYVEARRGRDPLAAQKASTHVPQNQPSAAHVKTQYGIIIQAPTPNQDLIRTLALDRARGRGPEDFSTELDSAHRRLNIKAEGNQEYKQQKYKVLCSRTLEVANTTFPYTPNPTELLELARTYSLHCDDRTTVVGNMAQDSTVRLKRYAASFFMHGSDWLLEELRFLENRLQHEAERVEKAKQVIQHCRGLAEEQGKFVQSLAKQLEQKYGSGIFENHSQSR